MNVLTRYLIREIVLGASVAMLILLTLFNLFTFADELRDLGQGDYGLREILLYLMLITPRLFYELMPSAALLGSVFVLGAMSNHRELVAMRTAGMSLWQVLRAICGAGLLLAGLSILVGETIAPTSDRSAQALRTTAQHGNLMRQTRYGVWLRDGDWFVNIRHIETNGVLADLNAFRLDAQRRVREMSHAAHAEYLGQQRWRLRDITSSFIDEARITTAHTPEGIVHSEIEPRLLDIIVVKPDSLSTYDLARYIEFLRDNNQKTQSFELALWSRVFNPLTTLIMLGIAAPFVMQYSRSVNQGQRLVMGITFGIAFNLFNQISGHIGLVYGLNPLLMAALPSLLILSVALWAWRRMR